MSDEFWYMKFTGPAQVAKAINVLSGILQGIASDDTITSGEVNMLAEWQRDHISLKDKKPFNEIFIYLQEALSDGVLSEDERDDLLWLCDKVKPEADYFCDSTARMQELHGIMKGVATDGLISKSELTNIFNWMNDNDDLVGLWPYSELYTLICTVLEDGKIDAAEHELILGFFNSFGGDGFHSNRMSGELPITLAGICEIGPDIQFSDNSFCFTGISPRLPRAELSGIVTKRGGTFANTITKNLNYLIVCDNGNKAWAFSAYGRKIEKAMTYRKKGHSILLVTEEDFHDALID